MKRWPLSRAGALPAGGTPQVVFATGTPQTRSFAN